jgi:hypothetical protein
VILNNPNMVITLSDQERIRPLTYKVQRVSNSRRTLTTPPVLPAKVLETNLTEFDEEMPDEEVGTLASSRACAHAL